VFGFSASKTLLDVSLMHSVVSFNIVAIKHILGLADKRAHASTVKCVRLRSKGKITKLTKGLGAIVN